MQTIGKKIGIGYAAMALLLLISGAAGYTSNQKLGDALELITGPVKQTADAVAQGIRGVQTQMNGFDLALRSRSEQAQKRINEGKTLAAESFEKISVQGLVPQEKLVQLNQHMQTFDQASNNLLSLDSSYRKNYQQLLDTIENSKDLLIIIEEFASRRLANAEWSMSLIKANDFQLNHLQSKRSLCLQTF